MNDTELCKARIGTPANHCWHDTGVALMSYPAKTEQVCCFCGQVRHLQLVQWSRTIGNHGAHLPYYTKLDAVGPVNEPEEEPCLRCGKSTLDTGWECTECGWDGICVYGPKKHTAV